MSAQVHDTPQSTKCPQKYQPPAIIFEKVVEAVAATCDFDPPLTKAGGGDGCTGPSFS